MSPDASDRYAPFRWTKVDLDQHVDDSARLADVYARWRAARGAAAMPRWDIALLEALPDATLPFVSVIDVNDTVPPFAYRFFGSGLANMHLFELTNNTTDTIDPPGFRHLCVDQHLIVIARREPMMFVNEVPTRSQWLFRRHLMLRLPYSRDGETVSQILTVEDALGNPEEVWAQFRQKQA